jgi:hypothetical protein
MSPKFRQTFYYLSSVITSVIGLALLYGGLKAGTADNITTILAGLGGLLGATGPALAGKKVGEQTKEGVFDSLSPADQISQGAKQLNDILSNAHQQADQAKEVLTGVLGGVPILGAQLEDALNRIKF